MSGTRPRAQGLYHPSFERDSCGVGFVANIKNKRSHQIVRQGLEILDNLEHRGACGCEPNTGDGAGILLQIPHEFYAKVCSKEHIELPQAGHYGIAFVFLPQIATERNQIEEWFEQATRDNGQRFLGWRDVPLNLEKADLGRTADSCRPVVRQAFIGRGEDVPDELAFERKLYVIRRIVEQRVVQAGKDGMHQSEFFYVPSFSCRTIIYKGMLTTGQVDPFYPDLADEDMTSAIALVHSRFSTNTFPSWELAQPFRMLAHNGEINTLRGNINWMRAREGLFESELFGDDIKKVTPVLKEGASDTATFDQALELLTLAGRDLPHAVMMMVPEAWENHESMSPERRAFYQFHASLMEAWDGPASIAFTDGRFIGAVLDRNGLRPSRYVVTKDDLCVMASEVGVLDIAPERVLKKGRLEPGRMFLIDLGEGRIIDDEELKGRYAAAEPYGEYIKNITELEDLPAAAELPEVDHDTVIAREQAFGYTVEDRNVLIAPSARDGKEPIGSMGNDTPLAVLSNRPRPLYEYFKQLFAQVTNPPLDAIREEIVTSAYTTLGGEGNLLKPTAESCRQISIDNPILDNDQFARIRQLDGSNGYKAVTLPMIFKASEGAEGLKNAIEKLRADAGAALDDGANILILSDRGIDAEHAPIPALLACAGVHHHLVRQGTRTRAGLVIESGEPREAHHFCLLIGYGASAVNPYLVFETIDDMIRDGSIDDPKLDHETAVNNYRKAMKKGLIKVMSKIGISTIQSYRGAQIFEAIGLNHDFIDDYFTHTVSRIEGAGLQAICEETLVRHDRAFPKGNVVHPHLDWGGQYKWRRNGEYHLNNPNTIALMQHSVRDGNYKMFKKYTAAIDEQGRYMCTLRGLFDLIPAKNPIPIEEVEPVEAITKRFKTGAMSFGSISAEAHETLAIAMNRIGGKSNTGEGGEDPARFEPLPNGDSKRSAIKQVASGRFGVTSHYLVNSDEIQIKMAQGAKPGEGGQLPGHKVDERIARVRHSTPGVGLISPPPHHDIYSIEDLAELIHDLKNANNKARINVKLVAEAGVGTVAAGVSKAHADVVLISGHDGGTGASPLTSLKHAGGPWELGLAETHQTLVMNDLRSRIVVETDGQLKSGRDVVIAALLGAEEYGFATTGLIAMGCIMMRACHLNTCPVGIATQDPRLREKFAGKPEHVVNFLKFIAQEVREIMAELGFRTIDEMIGHTERIDVRKALDHYKASGLDLSPILHRPDPGREVGVYCQMSQDHGLDKALDNEIIEKCKPALENKEKVEISLPVRNINRVVGTMLGAEISRRYGAEGLPEGTIKIHLKGSAGQSLGAFVPRGVTITVEGDANDYVGKGLSGGRIVVYPSPDADYVPEENIITGNVNFYGATSGEAFIRGVAGERFCVRNSGVHAVVEGIGDHGCEYMTGGRMICIGKTGRNFAAGMSGGIAYILDEAGDFETRCNKEMVDLDPFENEADIEFVRGMIEKHVQLTGSKRGRWVLDNFENLKPKFVKIMPVDYKRVLAEQANKNMAAAG